MAFPNFTESLDNTCLNIWGVAATFTPQDYSGPQTITGIISPPPLEEQVIPGHSQGVAVVYFFVRFVDITPNPRMGDTVAIDGVLYNVDKVNVDSQGSAMLHMRKVS
jgi:hypothetical protein